MARYCAFVYVSGESSADGNISPLGQTFVIHGKDWHDAMHHFRLVVKLDGRPAGTTKCQPYTQVKRVGMRTSSMETYQAYQFANLETTGASLAAAATTAHGVRDATDRAVPDHRCVNVQRTKRCLQCPSTSLAR